MVIDFKNYYTIELEHLKRGGLMDRWLIYDSQKKTHASQYDVIRKLNEFVKAYPLFEIGIPLSYEIIYIMGKENLNDEAIHKFIVIKEAD